MFTATYAPIDMILSTLESIFWVSFLLLGYVYVFYPFLIDLLSRLFDRKYVSKEIQPPVSIIITAYNEEKHIGRKIDNTLALDYPKERMEIIVGSDGSTDKTCEIARSYESQGVKLLAFPENRGKTMVQNDCARAARFDIIVFMDASSLCEPGSLRNLVAPFADARVGCVAGKVAFVQSRENLTTESQGIYWKYEQVLKRAESRLGSLVGVDGPLYAIRKERYVELRRDIISDLITPLLVIRDGYAVVYEPGAITYEEATIRPGDELSTRRRIVARGLLALLRYPELFNPWKRPMLAFQIVSHKILRWFAGLYFILMLISSVLLSPRFFYLLTGAAMVVFLMLAWKGLKSQDYPRRVFAVPYYFALVNWAALLGILDYLRGKRVISWKPVRS